MMIKLTEREIARLEDLANGYRIYPQDGTKTNASLIEKGLIEEFNAKISKTGRYVWRGELRLTEAGKDILKGFPPR
jgi:hypothetical protein